MMVKVILGFKKRIIAKLYRVFTRLFFPWNINGMAEERTFLELIHTMKKKIL